METLNSLLKAFIGLLLIVSFAITFSSCTKKEENQNQTDITSEQSQAPIPSTESNKGERWSEVREKVNEEEKDLNSKMKELEMKASSEEKKVKADIHKATEDIKTERDKLKSDSLNSEFSNEWKAFLIRSNNTLDSLRMKLRKK